MALEQDSPIGANDKTAPFPLQRIIDEDAVGQLRRRDGLMATLGSENGALKLDWVEGMARLLADPAALEDVEAEARSIRERGIRHIIWAGMGGSVIAVRVLCDLGFCHEQNAASSAGEAIAIYPLDSTDPAALNKLVRDIARTKHLPLPESPSSQPLNVTRPQAPLSPQAAGNDKDEQSPDAFLRTLLHDVMMIGVSMGMTSEEPITHLTWFTELLNRAQLSPAEHLLVMTLPGSYLDSFAQQYQAPSRPLQLDVGTGTGGRMSAPTTRVYLLPAALYLTGLPSGPGQLRMVLQHAWDEYNLELATSRPAEHPFVQLAAALNAASIDGNCRLLLSMPEGWHALISWIEQLMEESLGKGGKGVVVFDEQTLSHSAPGYHEGGSLYVHVVTEAIEPARDHTYVLPQPFLASKEPRKRLAALATSFLGWQLSMALYGYLHHIQFAGQSAVENYKARAHALRSQSDPLQAISNWHPALPERPLTLLAPRGVIQQEQATLSTLPASAFASALRSAVSFDDASGRPTRIPLGYLDVTINGDAPESVLSLLSDHVRTIGNDLLGVPVKLRQAPAAYHSTEQSEMDGPPYLTSLRLVARNSEACLLGNYTNVFLHAQAVSTWQAMMESGRRCFLLVIDGSFDDALEPLAAFFSRVERALNHP